MVGEVPSLPCLPWHPRAEAVHPSTPHLRLPLMRRPLMTEAESPRARGCGGVNQQGPACVLQGDVRLRSWAQFPATSVGPQSQVRLFITVEKKKR